MKLIAMVFLALASFCLYSCNKGGGGGGSDPAAAATDTTATTDQSSASTTTTTTTKKTASTGQPSFAFVGKGALGLVAADVDSVFFGDAAATILMYRPNEAIQMPTSDAPTDWSYLNIATLSADGGDIDKGQCTAELLKRGSTLEFCKTYGDDKVGDEFSEQVGNFTVDFMMVMISRFGFVSGGVAYGNDLSAIPIVKNIPQKATSGNDSATVVYARNDIFPEAFQITVGGFNDPAPVIPNDATKEQIDAIIAAQPKHTEIQIVDARTIQVETKLYHSTIDLNKEQEAMLLSLFKQGRFGDVSVKGSVSFVPTALTTLDVKTGHVVNGGGFAPAGASAPNAGGTSGGLAPGSMKLVDDAILLGDAKFTVDVNLDQTLSDDSNLQANPPTFSIKQVDGIPFGTEMTVTKK